MTIIKQRKNADNNAKELKSFGMVMGMACAVFGALFLWRGRSYYPYFFALSGLFFVLGSFTPILLKPVHKIWISFGSVMGWVVTRVILVILFYAVVTPIGLILRIMGKDLLNQQIKRGAESYWIMRKDEPSNNSRYEKQY